MSSENFDVASSGGVGVAVWGIGEHAKRTILPAINEVAELKLVCIGGRNFSVVKKESEKWGCAGYTSLHELAALDSVGVVIVATPVGCHAPDVAAVMEAGKHVWCEKAFTQNLDEALQLAEESRIKDLALCVSCPPLYHPLYFQLVSLLENGALGQIYFIDSHFGFPHVPGHSKYDEDVGGGALLDVGFHALVFGSSLLTEVPRVEAAILEKEIGFNLDTSGTALLRFPSGAHLISRWGYGQDYTNEIRIFGETGSIKAIPAFSKPPNLTVKMTIKRQNFTENINVPAINQFAEMLRNFTLTLEDISLRESYRQRAISQQQLLAEVQRFI